MTAPKKTRKPAIKKTALKEDVPAPTKDPVVDPTTNSKGTNPKEDTSVTPGASTNKPVVTGKPTAIPEEATPETAVSELADVNSVADYLTKPGISINDKLTNLCVTGPLGIRSVVSSLMAYLEEGGSDTPDRDPEYVLGKIYNLYSIIKSIVETPDASEFKVKMDILNLIIINNSGHGEAYQALRLLRFDHLWHWGEASLRTHQELITVITTLANKATRNDMLQKINLKAVLAGEGSDLTQDNLDRLIRYYTE